MVHFLASFPVFKLVRRDARSELPSKAEERHGLSRVRICATGAACVRVYRGAVSSAGIIVGAEASEARRSDSQHLRLDIEEAETRLSGRKGALPAVSPARLFSFPVFQSHQAFLPPRGGRGAEYSAMYGGDAYNPPQQVGCSAPPHHALPRPALLRPALSRLAPP